MWSLHQHIFKKWKIWKFIFLIIEIGIFFDYWFINTEIFSVNVYKKPT